MQKRRIICCALLLALLTALGAVAPRAILFLESDTRWGYIHLADRGVSIMSVMFAQCAVYAAFGAVMGWAVSLLRKLARRPRLALAASFAAVNAVVFAFQWLQLVRLFLTLILLGFLIAEVVSALVSERKA